MMMLLTAGMAIKLTINRNGDAPDTPPHDARLFDGPIITIGSDAAASLCLNGAGIAPEQAIIINEDGQMLLINRADGTRLNDEPLAREMRRPLASQDRLRIGNYVITITLPDTDADLPQTPEPTQNRAFTGEGEFDDSLSATDDATLQTLAPSEDEETRTRSFAAILDSLRTEEDTFYFVVEGGRQNGRRVAIDSAEMSLGWDATGQNLSFDAATLQTVRGIMRKDWSGVIIETQGVGMVAVNGEPVESVRRLRDGDRLMLIPTAQTAAQNNCILIFHEPASLVVLDTLLPQKLPPPVSLQPPAEMAAQLARTSQSALPVATTQAQTVTMRSSWPSSDHRFFGYFTLYEVLIMIAGTLFTAALVFLVLEYL
ncbi:MAG TPA: FHA domain-containing protein [Pyrinomonadaceae bacterium]|jgi:hypothetical protein